MSEQERRYPRRWRSNLRPYYIEVREPHGPSFNVYSEGDWVGYFHEDDLFNHLEDCTPGEWRETFDHLPPAALQPDELTALRTFRETVVTAAQTTPNHRLPQEIFAADDAVRRGMNQQEMQA